MTYEYEKIFHVFSCKLNNIHEIAERYVYLCAPSAYHIKGQQGKIYSGYSHHGREE